MTEIACFRSLLMKLRLHNTFNQGNKYMEIYRTILCINTGCAKKKKDILNIHIKSEGIKIFLQKFGYIEFTIFVVKCQKFSYIAQLFIR